MYIERIIKKYVDRCYKKNKANSPKAKNERFCVEKELYDCFCDFLAEFTTLKCQFQSLPARIRSF